jgi:glycosyltransferase 2 family protein
MNQKTWKLIKFIVGPLILIALFYHIGFQEMGRLLQQVNLTYALLAFGVFIVSVFIASLNLKLMLNAIKKIPWKPFLVYYLLSRVSALFLPGRLGDFSIAYFLKKENVSYGEGIAAVGVDKIVTIFCSVIVGLIGLHLIFGSDDVGVILLYLLGAGIIGLILATKFCRDLIKKYILRKYAPKFVGFSKTLFSYAKEHKRLIIFNILVTFIRMFVIAFSAQLMFKAVGVNLPIIILFLIGGIETMSTLIPITINGLGIKQSVGFYFFNLLGVTPEVVGTRYLIGLAIQYIFGFVTVLFIKKPEVIE